MPYRVVARPDIRTIADLRGQTIGINRFGGAAEFVLEYLLQQYGMDVERDVTLQQIGEQAERVAALRGGSVAATMVNPPFQTVARQYGLQVIFDTATLPVAYSQTVMVAQQPFLDRNSATVQAVLQGTMDGLRLFKQDREMATRVLGERLRIDDAANLTATWECYRDALSDDLVPRGLGVILDEALSEHPERAGLRVDDLMDLRALRDLQSQGQLP
jgi:ABC-type nitrate/sulfonate/bicarbonate transport system substrate-binding protein